MPSISVFLSSLAFFLGLYFIVFIIGKQLVLSLVSVFLNDTIDVNALRVGMIPAEQIIRVEQPDGTVSYERKQVEFSSGQDNSIIISPDPAGLSTDEIAQLQLLAAEGAFEEFDKSDKHPAVNSICPYYFRWYSTNDSLPRSILSQTDTTILKIYMKGTEINNL